VQVKTERKVLHFWFNMQNGVNVHRKQEIFRLLHGTKCHRITTVTKQRQEDLSLQLLIPQLSPRDVVFAQRSASFTAL